MAKPELASVAVPQHLKDSPRSLLTRQQQAALRSLKFDPLQHSATRKQQYASNMRETTKDLVETVSSSVLEAAVSAIPIFGAPLAIGLNKAMSIAESRRVQQLIDELSHDLEKAISDGRIGDPLSALSSDEFLANLHYVVRAAQETSDAAKRQRLRTALIHGTNRKWRYTAGPFTRLVDRLDEAHVVALSCFYEVAGGTHRRVLDGVRLVQRKLSQDGKQRPESYYLALFQQLAVEQLISVDTSASLREDEPNTGYYANEVRQSTSLKLTNRGMQFLDFLSAPTDDPPDDGEEGAPLADH